MSKVGGLLKEAFEAREKQQREKLMGVATSILDQIEAGKNELVARIRNARKLEKEAKKNLNELQMASAYFEETLNFGPLHKFMPGCVNSACSSLQVHRPTADEQKIPDGWKPGEALVEVPVSE